MDNLRAYIFSVAAAALLCSIVRTMTAGKAVSWAAELVIGLVMCLAVLGSALNLELPDISYFTDGFMEDGEAAAAYGSQIAVQSQNAVIKQQLEAYILEEAEMLSANIQVEVTVNDAGIPTGVTCVGIIPAGTRASLSRMITEELGIPEEAQVWTQKES